MPTIYNFEAKSIQNYILDSSKLKDMIGASEQIEYLCCKGGLLDEIVSSLKWTDTVNIARQAGGTVHAIFAKFEDAKHFQAIWTFCVQQAFPGLEFVQGMRNSDDPEMKESENLKKALDIARQELFKHNHNVSFPNLPLAGPLIARSSLTGLPAVFQDKKRQENQDAVTKSKRQRDFRLGTRLTNKLALKKEDKLKPEYDWPLNLDNKEQEEPDEKTFPLLPDNRYIGIIHADANNLGSLLQQIRERLLDYSLARYAGVMKAFSELIEKTTLESARQAIIKVLTGEAEKCSRIMPARPLVLGGDDFTFLVRGDLALDFTRIFLEEFEQRSEEKLQDFKTTHYQLADVLPDKLTAGAGIAYIKASQPFYQGYDLAESLCKYAKGFSKDHLGKNKIVPSSVAFHRITTSIITGSYEQILKYELTASDNILATMQPYLIGKVVPINRPHEFPHLNDLWRLSDWLQNHQVSHGAVREFMSLLHINRLQAEQSMQRWHDNLEKRHQTDLLKELKQILRALVDKTSSSNSSQSPYSLELIGSKKVKIDDSKNDNSFDCTPIGDALALISISKGSDYVPNQIRYS